VVEINKTIAVTVSANVVVKWILADTVPTTPTGYSRLTALDLSLGDLGTLWAFKQD